MYLPTAKGSRTVNRTKSRRHRAKIKAKNRARRNRVHQRNK